MRASESDAPEWLEAWMANRDILLWGAADLRDFKTPVDDKGKPFPRALSWGVPLNPPIMGSIRNGPNQAYADEYARVNNRINALADELAEELRSRGARAQALAASVRSDPVTIRGDFPQKTAATRAGLGWIGRHCQLVTRPFGSWVRLGTVFTDLELACGPPVERSYCGKCRACVEACPAGALSGTLWYPGIERSAILDVHGCDRWKKEHYYRFHKGHNCGICSAACPWGLKTLKK